MSTGNAQPAPLSSSSGQQITIFLNSAAQQTSDQHHPHSHQQQSSDHHQLRPPKIDRTTGDEYEIVQMLPVSSTDLQPQAHFIHVTNHSTITTTTNSATITAEATNINTPMNAISTSTISDQNQNINPESDSKQQEHDQQDQEQHNSHSATRFKWTEEKSQVAMNLVKYGCKPKLISVAVGCSLRTAQKFAETVSPKIEGESFKTYQIKRRGRKSKDVNQRLNAIKEVLSKDSNRTQVEIAADLKVSNTTVCRDLKRLGASWKAKKNGLGLNVSGIDCTLDSDNAHEQSSNKQQASSTTQQNTTTKRTRRSYSKSQKDINDTRGATRKTTRQKKRNVKTNDNNPQNNNAVSDPDSGQNLQNTSSNNDNVQQ